MEVLLGVLRIFLKRYSSIELNFSISASVRLCQLSLLKSNRLRNRASLNLIPETILYLPRGSSSKIAIISLIVPFDRSHLSRIFLSFVPSLDRISPTYLSKSTDYVDFIEDTPVTQGGGVLGSNVGSK